ncbi:PIG-L deacetylase family protein [Trujillonella endophytica]|uniref:PIG-L deacetylase family protein n=1 Tax=Trujillonella endophytica TaxID=673521 RepID=UPI003D17E149
MLGAGAVLLAARRSGLRVINLVCSLGRPPDHQRRRQEVECAARLSGIQLEVLQPPLGLSRGDDLEAAEELLCQTLRQLIDEYRPALIIGPHERDAHHAHELVGRVTRRSIEDSGHKGPWWAWGLWADLLQPTLYFSYSDDLMSDALRCLQCYAGENARNDYIRLAQARGTVQSVIGSERIFGFGAGRASELPYATLFTEEIFNGGWRLGVKRVVDATSQHSWID